VINRQAATPDRANRQRAANSNLADMGSKRQ
jgi:hypothetical protein